MQEDTQHCQQWRVSTKRRAGEAYRILLPFYAMKQIELLAGSKMLKRSKVLNIVISGTVCRHASPATRHAERAGAICRRERPTIPLELSKNIGCAVPWGKRAGLLLRQRIVSRPRRGGVAV
jgi:hypothetical protein